MVHVARSFLKLLVEVGSEHQVLVGMDDVSALLVNDKTVGFVSQSFLEFPVYHFHLRHQVNPHRFEREVGTE